MREEKKHQIKEKAIDELKRFAIIAAYLWVLFGMFEVHRWAILKEFHVSSVSGFRIGFALVNALLMGKIFLLGETLHVGERLRTKRLIHSVLFKAATFALFLIAFQLIEESIIGLIHGKAIAASIPGGLERKVVEGVMAFVVLIPFFLYTEVERVLGKENMHAMIIEKKTDLNAA
jgi:hypothetical protein